MQIPFYREAGAGKGVVCLHANASTSNQWRGLMELLAQDFYILAADSYGAGKSPPWPMDRALRLADEAEFLEPVFTKAGNPFCLVGHSYGAAVALIAALAQPTRVRALAVYEPTLFAIVDAESPPPNDTAGIRHAVAEAEAALTYDNEDLAAEHFIDFWMGKGSWQRTPDSRKPVIASSMRSVKSWGHALFNEPTPLRAFSSLDIPVLYMVGKESPPSSLAVARLLTAVLPRVEIVEFDGLGHMGPVTHPQIVNETIRRFLKGV